MDKLISHKAVIDALEKCHKMCCREDDCGDEWIHYETTVNEIECIPSTKQETSILTVTVDPDSKEIERVARKIKDAPVMMLPSSEPNRKNGKWIHGKEIAREYLGGGLTHIEYEDYHCSECGYTVKNIRWNVDGELVDRYCSVCGADMKGEQE